MANGEVTIASAALAVALTALVIAVGQLLQQVFSTAEGYRRCQRSVLGDWAQGTRLQWRWTQFRFEVKFVTPAIVLRTNVPVEITSRADNNKRHPTMRPVAPVDHTGRSAMLIPPKSKENTDLVGWISLLKQIELLQQSVWEEMRAIDYEKLAVTPNDLVLSPALEPREWSWDFMPPEVVRPLATTTVGTLVVLAHRMGMVWRDLQPSRGYFRAEGNGHSFTSTAIRGLGVMIQYTYDESYFPSKIEARSHVRIPTEAADKQACGIIPGCEEFNLADLHVIPGDIIESKAPKAPKAKGLATKTLTAIAQEFVATALKSIGASEDVINFITSPDGHYPIMGDLRSIYCPFLRVRGSSVTTVHNSPGADSEQFAKREARIVLQARLEQYLQKKNNRTPWLNTLAGHLTTLKEQWPPQFVNSLCLPQQGPCPDELIDFSHDVWDDTTKYFHALKAAHGIEYIDMVVAHLHLAVSARQRSEANLYHGKHRDDESLVRGNRAVDLVEMFHCYADEESMKVLIQVMALKGVHNRQIIVEAWWSLMVRAIFFSLPLRFLPCTEFPSLRLFFMTVKHRCLFPRSGLSSLNLNIAENVELFFFLFVNTIPRISSADS